MRTMAYVGVTRCSIWIVRTYSLRTISSVNNKAEVAGEALTHEDLNSYRSIKKTPAHSFSQEAKHNTSEEYSKRTENSR